MGKKNRTPFPNPGSASTIWIGPDYITDMATAFSDCAELLAKGWHDPLDAKTNAIYTNAVLALELYFKSRLVERVEDPAYMKITPDQQFEPTTEDDYYSEEDRHYIVVAQRHSRLVVPQEHKTHNVLQLFNALSQGDKDIIFKNIQAEMNRSFDMDDLVMFIESIKDYFVSKRYAFENFIEAVPSDSNYIYTVIPILRGVKKAFGYK